MGIRLQSSTYGQIIEMVRQIGKDDEFEASIVREKSSIKYYQFMKVLEYVIQKFKNKKIQEETLDIGYKQERITLHNLKEIKYFCKTGGLNVSSIGNTITMIKKTNRASNIRLEDYDIVVRLKNESPITDKNYILDISKTIKQENNNNVIYRLKKRFSVFSDDGLFRYDFTIVKQSPSLQTLITTTEKFEIEIEYIGKYEEINEDYADMLIKNIFSKLSEIIKVIDDIDIILPKQSRYNLIQEYIKLGYTNVTNSDINTINTRPGTLFMGPKPITMEKRHIISNELNKNTIFQNYTVTDKADGERHLFFVNKNGECYLINNRLGVKDIGLKTSKNINCIFDCELVKIPSINKKKVMMFDVYYLDGKNKGKLPLVGKESRVNVMKEFIKENIFKDVYNQNIYDIEIKKFYAANDKKILEHCKDILDSTKTLKTPYKIDGLIFTPTDMPVGAMNKSDEPIFKHITWPLVLKWKPPSDNTIDFLVRIVKNNDGKDIIRYDNENKKFKTVALYLGKNSKEISQMNYYNDFIKYNSPNSKYKESLFVPNKLYTFSSTETSTCKVNLDDNNKMLCESGEEIYDNIIVEMRFDIDKKSWIPLRIREDKTEQYKNTRNISGTANDYDVSCKTWDTIVNPITVGNITGDEEVLEDDITIEYYKRDITKNRNESSIYSMKEFHNKWVKDMCLIGLFKGTSTSLIDFACGEGGDLYKWYNAGFNRVLGIDISESNIMNPISGAFSRLLSLKLNKQKFIYVFIPLDSSKIIDDKQINSIKNDDNRHLAKYLWGRETPTAKNSPLYNMAVRKFNVASCQFSLHYFFKNQDTLSSFLTNVDNHVQDGGYFIGTCFDGNKVDELLRDIETNNTKYGYDNGGKKIWAIRKLYEGRYNRKTGNKIAMYIDNLNTENEEYDEYLVNFDYLVEELKKKKFRLLTSNECRKLNVENDISTGTFDQLYVRLKNKEPKTPWMLKALAMSDGEKDWSFLNRWFIFKKDMKYIENYNKIIEKGDGDKDIEKKDEVKPKIKRIVKKNVEKGDDEDVEKEGEVKPKIKRIVKKSVEKKDEGKDVEKEGEVKPKIKRVLKKSVEKGDDEDVEKEGEVKPKIKRIVKKSVEKKDEGKDVEKEDEVKPKIKRVLKKSVEKGDDKDVEKEGEVKPVEKKDEGKDVEKKDEVKPRTVKKNVEKKDEGKDVEEEDEVKPKIKRVLKKNVEKKDEGKDVEKEDEVKPKIKRVLKKSVENNVL